MNTTLNRDPKNFVIAFIVFLFLLAFGCSQSHAQKAGRWFTKCGMFTIVPSGFDTLRDIGRDSCSHPNKYYIYKNKVWLITKISDTQDGATIAGIVTPEQFGACGCNSGLTDFNAIQAAINTGKKVEFDGTKTYYVNGFLKRNKFKNLYIDMNFSTIIETNSGVGDVFGCDQPSNATEAVQMVNYTVVIKNGMISCNNQSQNGVNVRASSNSRFDNLTIVNANWGFRSEFMLQSRYTECTVLSSKNGWYIGTGTFAGADLNNSQSNYSWLIQPHTHTVSNVAVYVENVYGVRIDDIIVEGNGTVVNGVELQCTGSTTTKNLYINTGHFEQTGGLTGAFVKINSRDAIVEVTDVIMHYSGLVIDATSTTGAGSVLVTKCSYAVGVNGKYLKSTNTTWQFNYNNLFQCWNLPNLWVSPAPTRYSGNSGYNQYSCQDWAR